MLFSLPVEFSFCFFFLHISESAPRTFAPGPLGQRTPHPLPLFSTNPIPGEQKVFLTGHARLNYTPSNPPFLFPPFFERWMALFSFRRHRSQPGSVVGSSPVFAPGFSQTSSSLTLEAAAVEFANSHPDSEIRCPSRNTRLCCLGRPSTIAPFHSARDAFDRQRDPARAFPFRVPFLYMPSPLSPLLPFPVLVYPLHFPPGVFVLSNFFLFFPFTSSWVYYPGLP